MASSKTRVTELLAVLSRPGTITILGLAEKGIKSNTNTHMQFGLTQKQYHRRLLQLVRTGLIENTGSIYRQTRFGRLVWLRYLPRLEAAFMNSR